MVAVVAMMMLAVAMPFGDECGARLFRRPLPNVAAFSSVCVQQSGQSCVQRRSGALTAAGQECLRRDVLLLLLLRASNAINCTCAALVVGGRPNQEGRESVGRMAIPSDIASSGGNNDRCGRMGHEERPHQWGGARRRERDAAARRGCR